MAWSVSEPRSLGRPTTLVLTSPRPLGRVWRCEAVFDGVVHPVVERTPLLCLRAARPMQSWLHPSLRSWLD